MLLFDESKKLDEAFGPEKATIIAHILERQSAEQAKREQEVLATKADLQHVKFELIKWIVGLAIAQMALTVTMIALVK